MTPTRGTYRAVPCEAARCEAAPSAAAPAAPAAPRAKHRDFPLPLVRLSSVAGTHETRVMFREDFSISIVPLVRRLAAEHGLVLTRAYWETYRVPVGRVESICSLYLDGAAGPAGVTPLAARLQSLLAIQPGQLYDLYVDGHLGFEEFLVGLPDQAHTRTSWSCQGFAPFLHSSISRPVPFWPNFPGSFHVSNSPNPL